MRLTQRDRWLLEFVADHRLVLAGQAQTLLAVSSAVAYARLRALTAGGYLRQRRVFHGQPGCYQITRAGLRTIASGYTTPRIDLACYQHDVGAAWLWLAARSGAFGPVREVISERRLRSHDARSGQADAPLGVRLGGYGPTGQPRLHYPDLLLVLAGGQRVAVELELTGKGRSRRERILSGYAADHRIDAVLYLVERRAVGEAIRSSARQRGIGNLVHVQQFAWGRPPNRDRSPMRTRELTPSRPEVAR